MIKKQVETRTADDGDYEWDSTIVDVVTPIYEQLQGLVQRADHFWPGRGVDEWGGGGFTPNDDAPGALFDVEAKKHGETFADIEYGTCCHTDILRRDATWFALNPLYGWSENRVYFSVLVMTEDWPRRKKVEVRSIPCRPCEEKPLEHFTLKESKP